MITIEDIQPFNWYGEKPRYMPFAWSDGENGVNYTIEGVTTIDPLLTSKQGFVDLVNASIPAPPLPSSMAGQVVNPEIQTDEQRDFLARVLGMRED